jgi:hypothetical protein
MPVHSNRAAVDDRMRDAAAQALAGAAQVYRNAVTEKLRNPPEGGYTTGAWDHGMAGVAGSVAVSEVERTDNAVLIAVGTNVPYAKYWELGHQNLFTRRFERVERWRPALEENVEAIRARFEALFGAVMRAGQ